MNTPRFAEFVTLAAMLMSLVALSIDSMLPALPAIAEEFSLADRNDQQYVITFLFLGLGFGQLIYGPLSDAIGRRRPIFAGISLFAVGSILCLKAPDFNVMLLGRFLQGLGASSARIITMAIIRDRFEGTAMAQAMSVIMAVFILVPALAPLMGQGILLFANWHMIFVAILLYALIALSWYAIRLPETLVPAQRTRLSLGNLWQGLTFVLRQPLSMGAIAVTGLMYGGFVAYLSNAQQIFVDLYGTGKAFPFYFALLALAIGAASLMNTRLVLRFGIARVCLFALIGQCVLSLLMLILFVFVFAHQPPLWLFMLYCIPLFFFLGMQFGNLSALTMQPLGHIAGMGASVAGALSTTLAVPVGAAVGQQYNDTPIPLTLGFLLFGVAALLIFLRFCMKPVVSAP